MKFTVQLTFESFLRASLMPFGTHCFVGCAVELLQHLNETYLLFPLSAPFLCCNQGFVVGTALRCEVHLGQSIFYQCHRQIHTFNVQPANEVPCFVHAFHFNFHLENHKRRRGEGGRNERKKRGSVNVLYQD